MIYLLIITYKKKKRTLRTKKFNNKLKNYDMWNEIWTENLPKKVKIYKINDRQVLNTNYLYNFVIEKITHSLCVQIRRSCTDCVLNILYIKHMFN